MAIEVPRMKRFLEEGRMEGEKKSVLPSVGKKQIGGWGRTHEEKRARRSCLERC